MIANLAVATGTRAEYGIFRPLLRAFQARGRPVQLFVTGAHLSARYGMTVSEIEEDGFAITERVDIAVGDDSGSGVCRSIARAVEQFGDLLDRRRPDLLFLLGDRYETFAIAAAAQVTGIPVAHLHGGEVTEGAIDEAFRHAITKIANLHFVSTETHRTRVMQLGESPRSVFNVGALGLDNITALSPLPPEALERDLGFTFRKPTFLATYHPLTLDLARSERDFAAILEAFDRYPNSSILITAPNADPGGSRVRDLIDEYARGKEDRVKVVTSLGTLRYFSILRHVDLVIGNSSSGLIEVPAFHVPTVNVGDRQRGREAGETVLSVPGEPGAVIAAMETALSAAFQARIRTALNPYGNGNTANRICDILSGLDFPVPRQKRFNDLPGC